MQFHNTLGRKPMEFKAIHDRRVNMFVCGPTVQDHFHMGHARTYIFFDTLAKFMRSLGYSVFYLQNITDIDDKIINRAKEDGRDPGELAESYLEEYFREMALLRIDSVNYYARATRHMDEIISQISCLVEKGIAYEADDGVYFEVRKFGDYGELSGQRVEDALHGARVEASSSKRNPEDFVIWKKMKPGEPFWESPWGKGRPGWHVEDTAITEAYFGSEYDLHGGGSDLVFPHHEAENAIARSLSGEKHLARYWIHTGMLNINSEKMSKSLKNYRTIAEILELYEPEVLRFAMLNANYRTMLDFSAEMMDSSRENVEYITALYRKLGKVSADIGKYEPDLDSVKSGMQARMEDDIDTRGLITLLLEFCSEVNRNLDSLSKAVAERIRDLLEWVDSFMCIIKATATGGGEDVVDAILDIRRILRGKKEFELSDRIRSELKKAGIHIEDRNGGTDWWYE